MQGAMKRQADQGELTKADKERLLAQVKGVMSNRSIDRSIVGGSHQSTQLNHIHPTQPHFTKPHHLEQMDAKLASLKEELAGAKQEGKEKKASACRTSCVVVVWGVCVSFWRFDDWKCAAFFVSFCEPPSR